jgi:hypothetical protein
MEEIKKENFNNENNPQEKPENIEESAILNIENHPFFLKNEYTAMKEKIIDQQTKMKEQEKNLNILPPPVLRPKNNFFESDSKKQGINLKELWENRQKEVSRSNFFNPDLVKSPPSLKKI